MDIKGPIESGPGKRYGFDNDVSRSARYLLPISRLKQPSLVFFYSVTGEHLESSKHTERNLMPKNASGSYVVMDQSRRVAELAKEYGAAGCS